MWTTMLLAGLLAEAPSDHVTFLVMGKTINQRQTEDGAHALLNYHFFAEIFVRDGGRVSEATLGFPDGSTQAFEDLGFVQEVHGGRYDDERELDRAYPNGDYRFRFDTPGGAIDRTLRVRGTGEGRSRIPRGVRITLRQGGRDVAPDAVDPSDGLEIVWSPFADGEADARGILDDLMFAVVGNCRGDKVDHSGRPFEGTPYLTYTKKSYVVPAGRLAPGEPHQIYVEHAKVDTSRENAIVGLVTYAATTFLDVHTTGHASGEPCPDEMPKMDGGQTDRPEK